MNKFKEMDKKKKITISVIAILILLIGSAIAIYGVSATKSDDGKAKVEKNVKLSEKEENKAKNLESEMDEKLKNAKTEEEKEAIKKEYAEKIEKATDGKVTVSGNGNIETNKPSSKPSGGSSGSSISKPSGGSSSGSTGGSTSKPSKPTHTHSWQPVYETVTKYRTESVGKYVVEYTTSWDGATQYKYFDTNAQADEFCDWVANNYKDGGCNYYWKENAVQIQVPYTEEVLKEYKCSCGATQ